MDNDGQHNHRFQFTLSDLFLATFFVALGSCGFAWYLQQTVDFPNLLMAYASAASIGLGVGIVFHQVAVFAWLGVVTLFLYTWFYADPLFPSGGLLITVIATITWRLVVSARKPYKKWQLGYLLFSIGISATPAGWGVYDVVEHLWRIAMQSKSFYVSFSVMTGVTAVFVGLCLFLKHKQARPPSP